MKDSISETELYALKGLHYAAQMRRGQIDDIEEIVGDLIGEEGEYKDMAMEFIWNSDDVSVEKFLSDLKIGVTYDER